jgi:hypothetical protein
LIVKTPVTSVRFDGYDAGVIDFSISLQYAGLLRMPMRRADPLMIGQCRGGNGLVVQSRGVISLT